MKVPARVSFVTLAVRDMPRMQTFYDQFGWPKSRHSDDTFAAYQCGGAVLGLYGASNYEKAYGPPAPPGTFRGFVLAINCRDATEVDRIYDAMRDVRDITLKGQPEDLSFGGRGFEWSDPEGNVWEVTWAEGTSFDEREALIFP
jgi:catechol 2,3-dioxygenase-like lactoylglutathione lyase family enzyme